MYTMVELFNIDRTMGRKMFSTVGMYAIISIVTWIPRTTAQIINYQRGQLTTQQWVYSYIPLFAAGVLYTMVFLTEKKALILFDRAVHTDAGIDTQNGRERGLSSFSWEGSDFRFTSTGRGMSIFRESWRQSSAGTQQSGALRFSVATGSTTGPIRNSMITSGTHGTSGTDSSPTSSSLNSSNLQQSSSSTTLTLTRSPMSMNSTVSSLSAQTDALDDCGEHNL